LHRLLSPMRRKSSTRENNGPTTPCNWSKLLPGIFLDVAAARQDHILIETPDPHGLAPSVHSPCCWQRWEVAMAINHTSLSIPPPQASPFIYPRGLLMKSLKLIGLALGASL